MTIGDWEIDESGMIRHLKCGFKTWTTDHRCWIDEGYDRGHYVAIECPSFVKEISRIQYSIWDFGRRGKRA